MDTKSHQATLPDADIHNRLVLWETYLENQSRLQDTISYPFILQRIGKGREEDTCIPFI